jgi:hypothetical protein
MTSNGHAKVHYGEDNLLPGKTSKHKFNVWCKNMGIAASQLHNKKLFLGRPLPYKYLNLFVFPSSYMNQQQCNKFSFS